MERGIVKVGWLRGRKDEHNVHHPHILLITNKLQTTYMDLENLRIR